MGQDAPLSRRAARELLRAQQAVESLVAGPAPETVPIVVVQHEEPAARPEPVVVAPAPVDVPVIPEPVAQEPAPVPTATAPASDEDVFAAASRAFRSVTAETPVVAPAAESAGSAPAEAAAMPHVAPRGRTARRKLVAATATVGIMGIAGLLAVSMTLPAEAVAAAQGAQPASAMSLVTGTGTAIADEADEEIQAYIASSDVQNQGIERAEDYSTASLADIAAEQGITFSSNVYTNDPDAAIQWPFVVGVAMSSGYGMRDTGMHEGIDLVPGAGAPVQAIADGTVRIATESGGNYGVTVYIDHIIDGELITSHYSHMQYGSLQVSAGDTVKVGDIIGKVGSTGRSTGPHMHFELIVNGSTIDPLPWFTENAGRYDGVTSPVS